MTGRAARTPAAAGSSAGVGPVPPAARLTPARVGDLRLWLGLVLIAACGLGGALALSGGEDTVTVLRAQRDLSAGSPVVDVEPVAVSRLVAGDRYLGPEDDLAGALRWPVAAGELVPAIALGRGARANWRDVTVPVEPLHAPASVQPGDLVDVWSTPRRSAADLPDGDPVEVLTGVTVVAVAADPAGLSGELGVVLRVPLDRVAGVVAATHAGSVDLVAVPLVSQEPMT